MAAPPAMHVIDWLRPVRADGIVLHAAAGDDVLPWDGVASVRWDASWGAIVIALSAGDSVVFPGPFVRATGAEVAEKVERARLRAAMGMLADSC
jgi:hypothetical protein